MSTSVESKRRRTRTGTVVWGLIVVVVGLAFLTVQLTDIEFDPVIVILALLLGAGVVLVAAGLMSAVRGRDQHTDANDVTTRPKEGNL